jgi:peptidoglycan/LPS O-acetylase OafA/YrhL
VPAYPSPKLVLARLWRLIPGRRNFRLYVETLLVLGAVLALTWQADWWDSGWRYGLVITVFAFSFPALIFRHAWPDKRAYPDSPGGWRRVRALAPDVAIVTAIVGAVLTFFLMLILMQTPPLPNPHHHHALPRAVGVPVMVVSFVLLLLLGAWANRREARHRQRYGRPGLLRDLRL